MTRQNGTIRPPAPLLNVSENRDGPGFTQLLPEDAPQAYSRSSQMT